MFFSSYRVLFTICLKYCLFNCEGNLQSAQSVRPKVTLHDCQRSIPCYSYIVPKCNISYDWKSTNSAFWRTDTEIMVGLKWLGHLINEKCDHIKLNEAKLCNYLTSIYWCSYFSVCQLFFSWFFLWSRISRAEITLYTAAWVTTTLGNLNRWYIF